MQNKHQTSEQLYGMLLYLYPKKFRVVYGQQMRLTFRDACRRAYRQNGVGGLLSLWLPTLFDLLKSAFEERARQGEITMSKTKLIALAGPLTIVVGSLWLVVALGHFLIQSGQGGGERFLGLWIFPFFVSFIPLLSALIGIRLRFDNAADSLGRLGLALSVAGCAGVIVSVLVSILSGGVASEVAQSLWVNYVAVICFLSVRVGFILFGVDALRYQLLPRWNVMPLLLGSTVLLSLPMDWFGVPTFLPLQWVPPFFLHFALTGACWVLMGVAIMDQRREPQPVAAS